MAKKYLGIFILVLCFTLVACGKGEVQISDVGVVNISNVSDEGQNDEALNSDTIDIKEEADKLVINMYDDLTTEYKFSGEFVVEKSDVYHFESEDKANEFINSFEDKSNVTANGKDVIVKSDESSYLGLTKTDLMNTYNNLKEEYENGK